MKITKHGDNLHKLTKFTMMNCYLVQEDDGFTLIDTLMGGSGKAIVEDAQSLGQPIKRIVLTHAHVDHAGSLDELHELLPDAEIIFGERSAAFLRGEMALREGEAKSDLRGGYVECKTQPTKTVKDGDMIGSLKVVASPGHTPGHIALFDTRDSSLIAGDAFQTKGGLAVSGVMKLLFPLPAFATWDKETALFSAMKLCELRPSRLAVGHGQVLEEPMQKMIKAVATASHKFKDAMSPA